MANGDVSRTIAENLVLYRTLHGFTQAELAEFLSYSDKSVSKWERGEGVPDIFVLLKLSQIYGVTVSELIGQTPRCRETLDKLKAAEKDRKALDKARKKAVERIKKQKKKK